MNLLLVLVLTHLSLFRIFAYLRRTIKERKFSKVNKIIKVSYTDGRMLTFWYKSENNVSEKSN